MVGPLTPEPLIPPSPSLSTVHAGLGGEAGGNRPIPPGNGPRELTTTLTFGISTLLIPLNAVILWKMENWYARHPTAPLLKMVSEIGFMVGANRIVTSTVSALIGATSSHTPLLGLSELGPSYMATIAGQRLLDRCGVPLSSPYNMAGSMFFPALLGIFRRHPQILLAPIARIAGAIGTRFGFAEAGSLVAGGTAVLGGIAWSIVQFIGLEYFFNQVALMSQDLAWRIHYDLSPIPDLDPDSEITEEGARFLLTQRAWDQMTARQFDNTIGQAIVPLTNSFLPAIYAGTALAFDDPQEPGFWSTLHRLAMPTSLDVYLRLRRATPTDRFPRIDIAGDTQRRLTREIQRIQAYNADYSKRLITVAIYYLITSLEEGGQTAVTWERLQNRIANEYANGEHHDAIRSYYHTSRLLELTDQAPSITRDWTRAMDRDGTIHDRIAFAGLLTNELQRRIDARSQGQLTDQTLDDNARDNAALDWLARNQFH